MDSIKASALENDLQGKKVGQWTIERLLNHGKSAAVFLANDGAINAAIKIFDDELIAKYGDGIQVARIERELGLIGKSHQNLVKIIGGGEDSHTKNHYIAMEYLPFPNMKQCLGEIPTEDISSYLSQLSSAAKFLEELEIAHRDIKPENIAIDLSEKRLVLLDLGVIKPFSKAILTDQDGVLPFIGTLQYSSPELLLREEDDSPEGWRVT